jgi:AmiR/NasT family two-component response regulator
VTSPTQPEPVVPPNDPLDEAKTREQLLEEVRSLRLQVADLTQTLEDRKTIERAKGALMRRLGINEDQAHRCIRAASSNANRKLVEIARSILGAEEVFRTLEGALHAPGRTE